MNSTLNRVRRSIAKRNGHVVLRSALLNLGSQPRVDAAIAELVRTGYIVRLGRCVFAKTEPTQGGRRLVMQAFSSLAEEALQSLGIDYELSKPNRDFKSGDSDQVPARLVVIAKSRVQRKLSLGRVSLSYVSHSTRDPR